MIRYRVKKDFDIFDLTIAEGEVSVEISDGHVFHHANGNLCIATAEFLDDYSEFFEKIEEPDPLLR